MGRCQSCGSALPANKHAELGVPALCEACRDLARASEEGPAPTVRQLATGDAAPPASAGDAGPGTAKPKSPMLMYALIGGGVLFCCCCGIGGPTIGWLLWPKGDPLVGAWQSKDKDKKPEFTFEFKADGKGTYQAGAGEKRDLKWKVTDKKLETEFTGSDSFWTGEKKAVFNYTISGSELTLDPTASGQRKITFTRK